MHSGFVIVGADTEPDIRGCAVVSPSRVQDYDCVIEAPRKLGEFLVVSLLDEAGYGDDIRAIGLRPARELGGRGWCCDGRSDKRGCNENRRGSNQSHLYNLPKCHGG